MTGAQAFFYGVAVVLLVLAAALPKSRGVLALLGAASALLAYSLPTIATLFQ